MEEVDLSARNEETEFFNKLSKEWWDKNGPMRTLHSLNKVRVPYVLDCLKKEGVLNECYVYSKKPLTGLNILEVGCGGGIMSEALAKLGCNLTGVDPAADLIRVATEHAKLNETLKVQYINAPIEEFYLTNKEKYDAVVVPTVLEHVSNKEEFVNSCCKCLKPAGSIFMSAINKSLYSWFVTIVLWERVFRLLPIGSHDWDKYITPEDTSELLEANRCETKHSVGISIGLITIRSYETRSLSILYDLHAVKQK